MKSECLDIDGLILIELDLRRDDRGFFSERFRRSLFEPHGIPGDFAQDNHSRSAPGVLRGLHYQHSPPQGKLVGVTRGRIWDVAVDIRPRSATYGQSYGVELSDDNGRVLWMPPGFAHGFCILGDEPSDVVYKATTEYNPTADEGIIWNDIELNIDWPVQNPELSERDKKLRTFADYRRDPVNW